MAGRARRRRAPRCWWRRRARARPRWCRCACSARRGSAASASWCSSRAASRPGPRPAGWPTCSASRSVPPSGTAPATSGWSAGDTRIEVVTEGILVRRLQGDPSLEGTGAGRPRRGPRAQPGRPTCRSPWWPTPAPGLRPDLRVLAMSATVDADRFAERARPPTARRRRWCAARAGRYPVDVRHVAAGAARPARRPRRPGGRGSGRRRMPRATCSCSCPAPPTSAGCDDRLTAPGRAARPRRRPAAVRRARPARAGRRRWRRRRRAAGAWCWPPTSPSRA